MQPSKHESLGGYFSDKSGECLGGQPNTSLSSIIQAEGSGTDWPPTFDEQDTSNRTSKAIRTSLKRSHSSMNLFKAAESDLDVTDKITSKKDDSTAMPPPPKRQKTNDTLTFGSSAQEFIVHTGQSVKRITPQMLLDLFKSIRILTSQVTTLSAENNKLWAQISGLQSKHYEMESAVQALVHENHCLNLKIDNLVLSSTSISSPDTPSSPTSSQSHCNPGIVTQFLYECAVKEPKKENQLGL